MIQRPTITALALLVALSACADQAPVDPSLSPPGEAAFAKGGATAEVRAQQLVDIPVEQVIDGVGTLVGTLTITGLDFVDGQLRATGTLSGEIVDDAGNVLATITDLPFEDILADLSDPDGGRCDILFLDLGPLDLDVLGLVVNLSDVQLNVDAVPGPGNLLGNLLCAVVHLLDNPLADLAGLLNLLDRINDILGAAA